MCRGFRRAVVQTYGKDAGDVQCAAARTVLDLMAAGRAIGHDQRVIVSLAYSGQQGCFRHVHGDIISVRAVAERAGHAAAARFDLFDLEAGDEPQDFLHRREGPDRRNRKGPVSEEVKEQRKTRDRRRPRVPGTFPETDAPSD